MAYQDEIQKRRENVNLERGKQRTALAPSQGKQMSTQTNVYKKPEVKTVSVSTTPAKKRVGRLAMRKATIHANLRKEAMDKVKNKMLKRKELENKQHAEEEATERKVHTEKTPERAAEVKARMLRRARRQWK